MTYPIPPAALDDRLAIVGTAGSGKTYLALGAIEHLLARKARVICVDPLGVMWGLRLCAGGRTPSPFQPVIFGGAHGDLPINEHAGALVGETVATMRESCIIDLSTLGTKNGERRFMLAFLTALYRATDKEPVHLIIDEADMFAPQKLLDKEGDAAKLLGMMETVVRRGRVRGFIPWLITQRPAVLSKDVLSQADGIVALKLTSIQDRKAIGGWVESTADAARWREIDRALVGFQRGEGVLWIPARGICDNVAFPPKATFDSSRTPKRGEKREARELQPLNIDALMGKLATVEAEAKANDPRALKAEIARLQKELASKPVEKINTVEIEAARADGYECGRAHERRDSIRKFTAPMQTLIIEARQRLKQMEDLFGVPLESVAMDKYLTAPAPRAPVAQPVERRTSIPKAAGSTAAGSATLDKPLQRIVDAVHWWNVMGVATPSHAQVAFIAGYSHKSGTWSTYLSRLRSLGLLEGRGDLALTAAGTREANEPDAPPSSEALRATVLQKIDGPLRRILEPILGAYPHGLTHAVAADRAGYSAQSGTWSTYLSRLRSLDLIDGRGELKAQEWLFPC